MVTNIKLFGTLFVAAAILPGMFSLQAQNQPKRTKEPGYTLSVDVNLVILHVSVTDAKDQLVSTLKQPDFSVYEDKAPQEISLFKQEDVPVSMGLVIDSSGSMRTKRERVNAAALVFAKTSNMDDEIFLVNFNDQAFVDQDFTKNRQDLTDALSTIDARGGTALHDAVYLSLEHLKEGREDKKVLLLITDGEDRDSRYKFESILEYAKESSASIYVIGLFDKESDQTRTQKNAIRNLKELAEQTGGKYFFPGSVDEVEAICKAVAHEIRNQYTIGYRPTNTKKDGSWRTVTVALKDSKVYKKLAARTKQGYYAPVE
jgi:Ca-activated chloride channel family protein